MLLGISRAGKSTFSNMLHEKYSYNIIHADMIKASYQKHIDNKTSLELKNSNDYRLFIKDIFYHEVKYNKTNCVIDTVDIFPEDITDSDKKNYLIYFFGYLNIEWEELIDIWKKTDLEFTKKFTEEELIAKAKRGIENSKMIKDKCEKYGLVFIDTAYNRDETFKKLLSNIDKN